MKESIFLKTLSYMLIPVLVIIIILSASCIIIASGQTDKDILQKDSFIKTNRFIDMYLRHINYAMQHKDELLESYNRYNNMIKTLEDYEIETEPNYKDSIEDGEYKIFYQYWNAIDHNNFAYLIIDEKLKLAYTNLDLTGYTDTIEKIKTKINENKHYWNYTGGRIHTNLEGLQKEDILYTYSYRDILTNNSYSIYSSLKDGFETQQGIFYQDYLRYQIVRKTHKISCISLPIASMLFIVIIIYLVISAGHKTGCVGIHLSSIDKIPLEIILILLFVISGIGIGISSEIMPYNISGVVLEIIIIAVMGLLVYVILAIATLTIIKRIKAKVLIKSTLTYKVLTWTRKTLSKIKKTTIANMDITIKIGIIYIGFLSLLIIAILTISAGLGFFGLLFFMTIIIVGFYYFKKYLNKCIEIKDSLKEIYEGKRDVKLDEDKFNGELQEIVRYVNDIAGGFANAVEEGIKSEKMKTDLITNVSHDIKTPLTSIINYVDLLKKEDINSKKATEYLNILETKSQRLKKLTEDLVEASKASSGNIKLNMEKLDVKELIKQIIGEYEDKFKEKELEIVSNLPKENVQILADSRYMYRVIENLLSNVYKYALKGSRVYMDVLADSKNVLIQIKNISEERLNINIDELMQRFVRGDVSRNTEGSGLRTIYCKKSNRTSRRAI